MAEGFSPARSKLHEDGVYLDLPMRDYVNDPALSGSGFKKLLTSPADWRFEQPDNDLYEAPESDARELGTLVHCAVLEGLDAYASRYVVKPEPEDLPGVLRTQDDMAAWLKAHDQPHSGAKAVQRERIEAHWNVLEITGAAAGEDEPIFWDSYIEELTRNGAELIKPRQDAYVRQVHRVVSAWDEAQDLLANGLPEVSMFWTEGDGIRRKARFDWLSADAQIKSVRWRGPVVVDAKKFGRAPKRGHALWQHLQREVLAYDYDLQAVHNRRAALALPLLIDGGCAISASGEQANDRLDFLLKRIVPALRETPPLFAWLFLRTPGPPQGLIMPFGHDTRRWAHCEGDIEAAIDNYRLYRDKCGDGLWIEVGVVPWEDDDLPAYAWEIART